MTDEQKDEGSTAPIISLLAIGKKKKKRRKKLGRRGKGYASRQEYECSRKFRKRK